MTLTIISPKYGLLVLVLFKLEYGLMKDDQCNVGSLNKRKI